MVTQKATGIRRLLGDLEASLCAASLTSQDPRRQKLIAALLADFSRLSGES
jgi:hypothetical protein